MQRFRRTIERRVRPTIHLGLERNNPIVRRQYFHWRYDAERGNPVSHKSKALTSGDSFCINELRDDEKGNWSQTKGKPCDESQTRYYTDKAPRVQNPEAKEETRCTHTAETP